MHRRHNYWSKSRKSDDPFKEARKFRRRGGTCAASRGEGCEKNRSYVWHADLRVGKRQGSREEAVIGFRSQFELGGLPRLLSTRCANHSWTSRSSQPTARSVSLIRCGKRFSA